MHICGQTNSLKNKRPASIYRKRNIWENINENQYSFINLLPNEYGCCCPSYIQPICINNQFFPILSTHIPYIFVFINISENMLGKIKSSHIYIIRNIASLTLIKVYFVFYCIVICLQSETGAKFDWNLN